MELILVADRVQILITVLPQAYPLAAQMLSGGHISIPSKSIGINKTKPLKMFGSSFR